MILATSFAHHVGDYIIALATVYTIVIIAYVLSSLAFSAGLRLPYSRWSDAILGFLRDVSEPYLRIFRRVLPSIGGLDLSPLIGIIVLQAAARLLGSAFGA